MGISVKNSWHQNDNSECENYKCFEPDVLCDNLGLHATALLLLFVQLMSIIKHSQSVQTSKSVLFISFRR